MQISIQRVFDTSRLAASKVGQEIGDLVEFVQEFSEILIRACKNQLNFADNMDAEDLLVEIPHDTEQIIATRSGKTPRHVMVTRVVGSGSLVMWDSFGWYLNKENQLVVKIKYVTVTTKQTCRLVVCFS